MRKIFQKWRWILIAWLIGCIIGLGFGMAVKESIDEALRTMAR